jgi:transmembrane sensor
MSTTRDKATEAIIDEAAQWVVCLGAREVSLEDRRRFVAWLKRSPVHLGEYLRIESTWSDLGGVDAGNRIDVAKLLAESEQDADVIELSPGAMSPAPVARRTGLFITALAASIVLGLAAFFWYQAQFAGRYVTGVGEQRTARLDDGSTVVLNTGTELQVEFTDQLREVRLLNGEALFNVASDASRPFRVLSDRAVAQAIGTSFVVHRKSDQTIVTVIEGQVAVASHARVEDLRSIEPPQESLRLAAGSRARVADDAIEMGPVANPVAVTAWRSGRLIFDGQTLVEVAAEFNRYNKVQLVVGDSRLAGERLSGVFDASQPQSLVRFLERSGVIEPVIAAGDRIVLVSPR